MSNSIISITELNPATSRKFKDPRLAEATKRIATIYSDAAKFVDTKNREIASILSEVMEAKSYEKDGFKSVGDYAKEVFGINRQNAYSLATAGKVYNDKNASPVLKAMTPSKLAEVAKVPADTLKKAIDDGKITADTTQKDLREFAQSATKSTKPEVLPMYTARVYGEQAPNDSGAPHIMADWDKYYMADSLKEEIKLPNRVEEVNGKKVQYIRKLYLGEAGGIVVEFTKYDKNAIPATKPKFTKEQLLAMLAELEK